MNVDYEDEAPDFSLPDQNGDPWTLSAHWGTPVVMYFHAPIDGPDGVAQACAVRDAWLDFLSMGTAVVGISPATVEEIAAFVREHDLPHRVLSDTERSVLGTYGAVGADGDDVTSGAVIVNRDGLVAEIITDVEPHEQAREVLDVLRDVAG